MGFQLLCVLGVTGQKAIKKVVVVYQNWWYAISDFKDLVKEYINWKMVKRDTTLM